MCNNLYYVLIYAANKFILQLILNKLIPTTRKEEKNKLLPEGDISGNVSKQSLVCP